MSGRSATCFVGIVFTCLLLHVSLPVAAEARSRSNGTAARGMKKKLKRKKRHHHRHRVTATELDVKQMGFLLGDKDAKPEDRILGKAIISLLGTPYRFGGDSVKGIDCSAFVQKVFGCMHVSLPRTAREQFAVGKAVPADEIRRGDLLFFKTYAPHVSHVGIYLGNDLMIHASSCGSVVISPMNSPFYRSRYVGARRIDNNTVATQPQQSETS